MHISKTSEISSSIWEKNQTPKERQQQSHIVYTILYYYVTYREIWVPLFYI